MSLDLVLERSSATPLYQQIADGILRDIRAGLLSAGMKLPSTRAVAKQLGIHRRTVVQAFALLERDGWVTSGVGQGTFVSGERLRSEPEEKGRGAAAEVRPRRDGQSASEASPGSFSWESALRRRSDLLPDLWRHLTVGQTIPGTIHFTGATADPTFFPAEEFRAIVDEIFRTLGSEALEYGPAEGLLSLREWVAGMLESRGVRATAEQVVIVSGSQQGLDLISRLLVGEGDIALVEEPGYTSGFRLFQANGARVVGVPLDQDGLRCDLLDEISARTRPSLIYLMPIFQNPTGLCLSGDRIDSLLEICGRRHLPIVEDQFDADLFYEGEARRPLKSRDRDDMVVLLGSFSKILFPGLRLGWLVVPRPLAAPLRALKQMADFSSSLLAQHAMELYCRRGLLERHLEKVRSAYGARLRVMLASLEEELPAEASWTRPRGGLTLWVTLPPGIQALELLAQARREGVDFSPGTFFYPNGGGAENVRLTYIRETEERIRQGIHILGGVMKRSLVGSAEAASPFI
jgi:GntR family transcriptional regulator/MocR family aminotransferase